MTRLRLEREKVVLLIIDLQEKLMKVMKDREKVFKNTRLLIETAKTLNIPVILTEQYPKGLGPTCEDIKNALGDYPYEYLEKMSFTACTEELRQILSRLAKKYILVAGSETHVCVYQTVRDLCEDGYFVHVAKDAVCSRFDINHENGLQLMREAGGIITNTETIIFDLLKFSGTPEFKAISPLLK
ncbi:Nicotinamidase-related amidase [Thermosyntropha lipolytica DSM 11003]|uniref:Nicotinamidase-related amidase n=1 Tax=Thermosyntropha lipolytica DSM 11003 TaxID=1123382 RepID=A0A1M5L6F0_9FIRM|nr:isochorismatase family protein [Thermosyntropha lipolytica]SHG60369.1 Nicotinamidase-related amidase [Thermosyntropha lipolytica DSM 11003]